MSLFVMTVRPEEIRFLERSIVDAEVEGIFEKWKVEEVRFFGGRLTETMKICARLALRHRVVMRAMDPGVRDALDHFVT